MDNAKKLADAKAFAKSNIVALSAELVEWHDSGLLRGPLLLQLGDLCKHLDESGHLRFAESLVSRAAFDALANSDTAFCGAKTLASEHQGMRVAYSGLLGQCRRALCEGGHSAHAEMLRQLQAHLQELGRRWYAGDVAVVDELLQLYCVEAEARAALKDAQPAASAPEPVATFRRIAEYAKKLDERKDFENWAADDMHLMANCNTWDVGANGSYLNPFMDAAWRGFKAGRALTTPAAADATDRASTIEWSDGEPPIGSYGITAAPEPVALTDADLIYCKHCQGTGESTHMVGSGPDAHEEPCNCDKCGGTGVFQADRVVDVGLLEYRGNSVSHIHSRMTAYRSGLDAAWEALRKAGVKPDGHTSIMDGIARLAASQPATVDLTKAQLESEYLKQTKNCPETRSIAQLDAFIAGARFVKGMAAPAQAQAVPDGWSIRRTPGKDEIGVSSPPSTGPGCMFVSPLDHDLARRMLYALCKELLAAAPTPSKGEA